MRLLALKAENWLSYPELSLDFTDVQQVVVTGPNGHGKSALLDAVRYSLFGEGRGSADEMVAHGALSTTVSTEWLIGNQVVGIQRSRDLHAKAGSTDLRLVVNGDTQTQHTIADTQRRINELLRIEPAALMATAFMVQGESDSIMRATPASRKELLVELLGLDRYEPWHEEAKSRARSAKADAEVLDRLIPQLRTTAEQIAPSAQAMERHGKALKAYDEDVDSYVAKAEELKAKVASLKEREQRLEQLNVMHADASDQLDRAHKALARARSALAATEEASLQPAPEFHDTPPEQIVEQWQVDEHRVGLSGLKGNRAGLKARLEMVEAATQTAMEVPCGGKGKYAACKFLNPTQDATPIRQELATIEAMIEAMEEADPEQAFNEWALQNGVYRERKARHESALAHWEKDQARIAEDLPKLREQVEHAQQAIVAADKFLSGLQRERLQLSQDHLGYSDLEGEIRLVTQKLNFAKDKRDAERLLLDEARLQHKQALQADEALAANLAKRDAAVSEMAKWDVLAAAFHRDGIPTMILENTLPAIEAKANDILADMPGGFAIEIVTQRQTKTSGMRETLDISVLVDGMPRTYSLLSGGERFRVDFALRVALSSVLSSRSGASLRTLWLDEPLAHLDRIGRESVLDTLNAVGDAFDLVVVVSHHDEFNDRFPSKIEVSKNGHSTAVLT